MTRSVRTTWPAWIALAAAPAAWAVAVQLGQILPYVDCARGWRSAAVAAAVAVALATTTAALSWRWARNGKAPTRTLAFVAAFAALVALGIAFAAGLQVAAGLVLSGCER